MIMFGRGRNSLAMVPQLTGLEQDQARVRVGAADYLRGETAAASRYLRIA